MGAARKADGAHTALALGSCPFFYDLCVAYQTPLVRKRERQRDIWEKGSEGRKKIREEKSVNCRVVFCCIVSLSC